MEEKAVLQNTFGECWHEKRASINQGIIILFSLFFQSCDQEVVNEVKGVLRSPVLTWIKKKKKVPVVGWRLCLKR